MEYLFNISNNYQKVYIFGYLTNSITKIIHRNDCLEYQIINIYFFYITIINGKIRRQNYQILDSIVIPADDFKIKKEQGRDDLNFAAKPKGRSLSQLNPIRLEFILSILLKFLEELNWPTRVVRKACPS